MTRKEFEKVVQDALDALPEALRRKIDNVEIRIAESPSPRQAREWGRGRLPPLYGLYEGTPYGERGPDYSLRLPDRITLFRRAIERDCRTRPEMIRCIRETVLHELGHYFGLDDEQLEGLGLG